MKADRHNKEFKRIFGESLMNYFSFIFGFDVIKFDEEFVKPNEGESTNQAVERKFGKDAVELCHKLMA
jgi:EAL domain-containing protein (putative c-di-GMP-specific phosphodiesterase class I)